MANKTSTLQKTLENIWYKQGKGKYLLLPLSALYCSINRLQRWLQTSKQNRLPCPIIVVGNITVGGTGKTPLVIYLTKLLQQQGYKPGIITRGYGGNAKYWPQQVTADSNARMIGDEALLMAIRTGVPVYAGPKRMETVKECLHSHYCDVIISDDGMQHYKLPRDIQIAVIDGERKLGNGLCLPAGPLREKKERLEKCDLIIVNGEKHEQKKWIEMKMSASKLINLKTGEIKHLQHFAKKNINAVTGIGNPQRFYHTLEQAGLKLQQHSFPDHYQFQENDLKLSNDFPILMTEKDAVKCKLFADDNCWYLPINAQLEKSFDKIFIDLFEMKLGGVN